MIHSILSRHTGIHFFTKIPPRTDEQGPHPSRASSQPSPALLSGCALRLSCADQTWHSERTSRGRRPQGAPRSELEPQTMARHNYTPTSCVQLRALRGFPH